MEQKSVKKVKSKIRIPQFNLYVPEAKRLLLPGDFSGCVLVIPERFGIRKDIGPYPKRFSDYHL
jgi:hypothetical protein